MKLSTTTASLRRLRQSIARSFSSTASSGVTLHYDWIQPQQQQETVTHQTGKDNEPPVVMLHGLLGNGRNVKTLASKVASVYKVPVLTVDVRGHGKSKGRNDPSEETTFNHCIEDIAATLDHAGIDDKVTFVGHSLGGRLAMEYVAKQLPYSPTHVWLLDTVPKNMDSSVKRVVEIATIIEDEYKHEPMSRKELTDLLTNTYKLDKMTAQWLASNYVRDEREFNFDLRVANHLVKDFNNQDFLGHIHRAITNDDNSVRIDMVRGTRNQAWEKSGALDSLRDLEGPKFQLHSVNAGHWVHIDDLPGVVSAIESVPRHL